MTGNAVASKKQNSNAPKAVKGKFSIKDPSVTTSANSPKKLYPDSPISEVREVSSVFFKNNRGRMLEDVRLGVAYIIHNKNTPFAILEPFRSVDENFSYPVLSSNEVGEKRGEILKRTKNGEFFVLKVRDTIIAMLCPPPAWATGKLSPDEMLKLKLLETVSLDTLKSLLNTQTTKEQK